MEGDAASFSLLPISLTTKDCVPSTACVRASPVQLESSSLTCGKLYVVAAGGDGGGADIERLLS